MRRILLVIILAAGVMYVILHCNLWRTNGSWLPPTDAERKEQLIPCAFKSNVSTILKVHKLYPFLCPNNFLAVSGLHGNNRIELPYGVMKAEKYFQLALSRLENCGLFSEEDRTSCKKCVVVGNGGILRNRSLGEAIDSYDVVIRYLSIHYIYLELILANKRDYPDFVKVQYLLSDCSYEDTEKVAKFLLLVVKIHENKMNNGPVVGYEEDVGRRTTFRLFYPESVFSDPVHYDPNTTAVLVVFKPHDLRWLWDLLSGQRLIKTNAFWKKPAMQMIYKSDQIRILDPALTRITAHDWLHLPTKFSKLEKPKHPTTGLIAITFAFHICSKVHLAGFKYNFSDRNSSLHYYGNDTMSLMIQNGYHDIAAEQKFLKELMDYNLVVNLTEE